MTIDDILTEFRTYETERLKGTKFERLMRLLLVAEIKNKTENK